MSFLSEDPSQIAGLDAGAFCLHDLYFYSRRQKAFRRDNPNATVQFLDTGHCALETHLEEIVLARRAFLGRLPPDEPRYKEVTAVIDEAASLPKMTDVK